MILGLRTDKQEAELYLFNMDYKAVNKIVWQAHRELSDTLLIKIETILHENKATIGDIQAIIAYQGPGSFTGLRIGLSVANALAYALNIPIAAAEGEAWQQRSFKMLNSSLGYSPVVPAYGADVSITTPRK